MGDQKVPDYGLERLGMGGDKLFVDRRNDDDGIAHFRGIAAVTADDTEDCCAAGFGEIERAHDIDADVALGITAADGKYENRIRQRQSDGDRNNRLFKRRFKRDRNPD